jgi:hypothetical protein
MAKATNSDFDNFVRRQQPISEEERIDWNKQRDEWLTRLDALYAKIQEFLQEYVNDGSIKLSFQEHRIIEENIGAYASRRMIIHIGRREITLTPIGTLLIGSAGRVDVTGSVGRARLVLVDKNATSMRSMVKIKVLMAGEKQEPPREVTNEVDWTWKIVTAPPAVAFKELNKDSFFQLLMEVSNA